MKYQLQKFARSGGFGLNLTFACPRENPACQSLVRRAGASAKAGVLKFVIVIRS